LIWVLRFLLWRKWDYWLFAKLKISKTDSDSIRPLTNKPALIQTATYLKSVSDRAKKTNYGVHYVWYRYEDGKLDSSDIKCLYLSDISGKRFTKCRGFSGIDWLEFIDSKKSFVF
jgi:hypothetical protein